MLDNQTLEEWLSDDRYTNETIGTGLFLFTDADDKAVFPDLTYDAALELAFSKNAFAMKWVPDFIMGHYEITTLECTFHRCVRTCKPRGCICNRKTGYCK